MLARAIAKSTSLFQELTNVPQSLAGQARKRLMCNSAANALVFVAEPYLNPADPDYGITFDGVTDDTTALNNFFASIPASGGIRTVFFPSTNILVSGQITNNRSDLRIVGMRLFIKNSAPSFSRVFYNTGSQVSLEGCYLNGNCMNNATLTYHGIESAPVDDFIVEKCDIVNVTNYGIYLHGTSTPFNRSKIRQNRIKNVGSLGIYGQYCVGGGIYDNDIVSCGGPGIQIGPGTTAGTHDTQRFKILDNYIDRATPPTNLTPGMTLEWGFLIALDVAVKYIEVRGNICWDNRNASYLGMAWDGIGIGLDGVHPHVGIVITDNIVGYAGGFGIDATYGSIVSNNYIANAGRQALVLECDLATDNYRNTIIDSNIIIDPIENLSLAGLGRMAVLFAALAAATGAVIQDISFTNNLIKDTRATKRTYYGITLDSTYVTFTNIDIRGNNLRNIYQDSITLTGTGFSALRVDEDNLLTNNYAATQYKTLSANVTSFSALATPAVKTNNTVATTLNNITGGYDGQRIKILIADGSTTINETGNIVLSGITSSLTFNNGDAIEFIYDSAAGKFKQLGAGGGGGGGGNADGGNFLDPYVAGPADIDGGTFI